MSEATVPNPVLRAWLTQLLSEDVLSLLEGRSGQIEVRLFANNGRVNKDPIILLNAADGVRL